MIRRSLFYWGRSRPDMPEGCPERFNLEFYRFIWRTRQSSRDQIRRLIAQARAEKSVHVLHSLRDVDRFLDSVSACQTSGTPTGGMQTG